jgi:hypothetical protein
MSYIEEKTIYKLMGKNRVSGFTVAVTEDGVEIDTDNGLNIIEFIEAIDILLVLLKEKYNQEVL